MGAYRPSSIIYILFPILLGCEVGIFVFDIIFGHFHLSGISGIRKICTMTREDGLVTWFSSFQYCLGAFVALAHAWYHMQQKTRWKGYAWGGVMLFFLLLSIDDTVRLHERIGTAFSEHALLYHNRDSFFSFVINMFPSYTWQITILPIYMLLGVGMLFFMWQVLSSEGKWLCILAGALYGIAILLDFYEGMEAAYRAPAAYLGMSSYLLEHLLKAIEEFLEMLGTTCFILAFIHGFTKLDPPWSLELEASKH